MDDAATLLFDKALVDDVATSVRAKDKAPEEGGEDHIETLAFNKAHTAPLNVPSSCSK